MIYDKYFFDFAIFEFGLWLLIVNKRKIIFIFYIVNYL